MAGFGKLTYFRFNGGEHKFITIPKFEVHRSKEPNDHKILFNKQKAKDAVSYFTVKLLFLS